MKTQFSLAISIVPTPYPAEFRRDVIAVARQDDQSLAQVPRNGISESCLSRWPRIRPRRRQSQPSLDKGRTGTGSDLEAENRELPPADQTARAEERDPAGGDGLLRATTLQIVYLLVRDHAADTQLRLWLPKANARTVRALKARPIDLLGLDKAAMLAVPPVPPAHGFAGRVRLPRDYYVRVFGNDYSVHPSAIGRMVDVVADLALVSVRLEGRLVAEHARSWGNALTITDPDHVSAAARLREAFGSPRTLPVEDVVVLRDLAEYDAAFGVNIEVAS